jgi:hypothetical protein
MVSGNSWVIAGCPLRSQKSDGFEKAPDARLANPVYEAYFWERRIDKRYLATMQMEFLRLIIKTGIIVLQ